MRRLLKVVATGVLVAAVAAPVHIVAQGRTTTTTNATREQLAKLMQDAKRIEAQLRQEMNAKNRELVAQLTQELRKIRAEIQKLRSGRG